MPALPSMLETADRRVTRWMADHAVLLMRIALGILFVWFGFLKYFPGVSSEESIATRTMSALSLGLLSPAVSRPLLATWECAIGIGLMSGKALRLTLLLLFVQMLGTLMPLVLFRADTFAVFPLVPTLQGQFIMKNLVLIAAGIFIGATVPSSCSGGNVEPSGSRLARIRHRVEQYREVARWA